MLKSYPYRNVNGRRVRDYAGLTVEQVVAAVGDDEKAAARALEQEQESSKPRKTLADKLEKIAETDE